MLMKNKLIEENMNLVYFLVKKHYPTYIGNDDVIQEGMVGLCKAASNYDESKCKFSTYASKCILNQIRNYFRESAKHHNILSLDYDVKIDDTSTVSFMDTIAGDCDIDIKDVAYLQFYKTLDEKDREFLDLQLTLSNSEIADILGISQVTVNNKIRRLKREWNKFNEN